MIPNIESMNEKLEALALQGPAVELRFRGEDDGGRGGWRCVVQCEDGASFEGVSVESAEEAVDRCYRKAFAL